MAVIHYGNQEYQGLSTDTKPVAAQTAVNAIFEETDTGNKYRNSGSAWVLSAGGGGGAADPAGLPMWIVYKAGTTYKARNGVTGLTPYSGTDFVVNVWNNIVNNPASGNHIHFLNSSTPYDIPSGQTLALGSTNTSYLITGESYNGVKLRPLGNSGCMTVTNVRHASIENLQFYVDLGATYTADIVRVVGTTGGGGESIELSHIKMRHDDGTSTIIQTGRNLVLLLSGTDPDVSWVNCHDCHFYGCDSVVNLTSSTATGALAWANDIIFTRVHGTYSKHYFLSQLPAPGGGLTASMAHRWVFRDCTWQTTPSSDTTATAMFRIVNNASHRNFLIDGCMMWDPFSTNVKFLNINSTDCRLTVTNSEAIGDAFMGGTSWDATNNKWLTPGGVIITREGEFSEARGVALAVADGATITHGMKDYGAAGGTVNATPKRVYVQGTVAGQIINVTAITSTSFTVAIKTINPAATTAALAITPGTTQTIYWRAEAYN